MSGVGLGSSGISGGGSGCRMKMFGRSETSCCGSSAMRCFSPASQRWLLSSGEIRLGSSVSRVSRGVVSLTGGVGRVSTRLSIEERGRGLFVSTAIASVAPRRWAQSTALSPRLSRNCGSAPASSKSGRRCVWPKMVARINGVCPPPVRSFTSAPLARTVVTALASPEVTACVNGTELKAKVPSGRAGAPA